MSTRDIEVQKQYEKFQKESGDSCSFCTLVTAPTEQVVTAYDHMLRIKNRFPYLQWENTPVADHLMIIPKRHILHLHDFTDDERTEYFNLLVEAEKDGYSIYHRSQHNHNRSMKHLHTHLLRLVRPA